MTDRVHISPNATTEDLLEAVDEIMKRLYNAGHHLVQNDFGEFSTGPKKYKGLSDYVIDSTGPGGWLSVSPEDTPLIGEIQSYGPIQGKSYETVIIDDPAPTLTHTSPWPAGLQHYIAKLDSYMNEAVYSNHSYAASEAIWPDEWMTGENDEVGTLEDSDLTP